MIRDIGRVTAALSKERPALEGLVRDGAATFSATAAHRNALGEAVRLTPPALDASTITMRRIDRTLNHLDPLVRELRPGARRLAPALAPLRPSLQATDRLLQGARPLLRDLSPALRDLGPLSTDNTALIAALQPTIDRLEYELIPFLKRRDDGVKLENYQAIGPLFSLLAAPNYDRNGWFYHFPIPPSPDSLMAPCAPTLTPGQLQRCRLVNDGLAKVLGPTSDTVGGTKP
jgi:phospholipid/cholesterol/gamma-HCH transport system substrate-binding protein